MVMTQNSEKLENVAMVTLKFGIADFGAQFGPEWLRFWYQMHFVVNPQIIESIVNDPN